MSDHELMDQTKAIIGINGGEEGSGGLWRLWSDSVGWKSEEEEMDVDIEETVNSSRDDVESNKKASQSKTAPMGGKGKGYGNEKTLFEMMRERGDMDPEEQEQVAATGRGLDEVEEGFDTASAVSKWV